MQNLLVQVTRLYEKPRVRNWVMGALTTIVLFGGGWVASHAWPNLEDGWEKGLALLVGACAFIMWVVLMWRHYHVAPSQTVPPVPEPHTPSSEEESGLRYVEKRREAQAYSRFVAKGASALGPPSRTNYRP
jgi:hypothetical protein